MRIGLVTVESVFTIKRNAKPHTLNMEAVGYCKSLLPLLDPVKKVQRDDAFRSYGEVKAVVVQCFRQQPNGFSLEEDCLFLVAQNLRTSER